MERNKVVYAAADRSLTIGQEGAILRVSSLEGIHRPNSTSFKERWDVMREGQSLILPAHKLGKAANKGEKEGILAALSAEDLAEAIERKKSCSREEGKRSLPEEISHFVDVFLEDGVAGDDVLPPHRAGVDTKIVLQRDEQGREKEVPWGPLYGMSREELLVLRKTLNELLDKKWIRGDNANAIRIVMVDQGRCEIGVP
ncbi:hypothetical protein K3495_g16527 [Podosphaera aphanis]|nr:hypothetical protein K3495_g16527 [Podosphaera aphanis]